jgi:hypothetical protein
MRRTLFAAAAFVLAVAPALAADDPMAGFYGNTVEVTGPSFNVTVHYRADHTMDSSGTIAGKTFSTKGTWKVDDKGQLCRTYDTTPPTMTNPFCTPATPHKVGDTWTATTPDGSPRTITLKVGT